MVRTLASASAWHKTARPPPSRSRARIAFSPACHCGARSTSWTNARTRSSGASTSAAELPPITAMAVSCLPGAEEPGLTSLRTDTRLAVTGHAGRATHLIEPAGTATGLDDHRGNAERLGRVSEVWSLFADGVMPFEDEK